MERWAVKLMQVYSGRYNEHGRIHKEMLYRLSEVSSNLFDQPAQLIGVNDDTNKSVNIYAGVYENVMMC